jgi:hypothetical protein
MSALDSLPPDQKAVLQLLLKQGKSYDDLSKLLRIEPGAVRDRALDAMDALGPEDAPGLDEERQDEVADYLLGQGDPGAQASTRGFLERSAGGRAWARVVAGELQPLAPAGLPEIPQDGADHDDAPPVPDAPRAAVAAPAHAETPDEVDGGEQTDDHDLDRGTTGDARAAGGQRSSKVGGAILLAGILALLAIVLVFALTKKDDKGSTAKTASTPTGTTSSTPGAAPKVEQQINLTPAVQGSKALGVANVVSQQGQRAIALIGQGVKPPGTHYAVWLTNGTRAQFLGFAPPVKANGRLQGLAGVPKNLGDFRDIIVTREPIDKPKQPGPVVLRGSLRAK